MRNPTLCDRPFRGGISFSPAKSFYFFLFLLSDEGGYVMRKEKQ